MEVEQKQQPVVQAAPEPEIVEKVAEVVETVEVEPEK